MDWETGYHYTSYANWLKIQKSGLTPTPMSPDKIAVIQDLAAEGWDGRAIWVWAGRLTNEEHAGSLMYQVAKRGTVDVVMLKVRYPIAHRLKPNPRTGGTMLRLKHNGHMDQWVYHHETPSWLVVREIPPSRIQLELRVNVVEALCGRQVDAKVLPIERIG